MNALCFQGGSKCLTNITQLSETDCIKELPVSLYCWYQCSRYSKDGISRDVHSQRNSGVGSICLSCVYITQWSIIQVQNMKFYHLY